MSHLSKRFVLASTLLLAAHVNSACSQSNAGELQNDFAAKRTIASDKAQGVFANQPFVLGKVIATRILHQGREQLSFTFAPAEFTSFGCGSRPYPTYYVGASAPNKIGTYEISTAIFNDLSNGQRPEASVTFVRTGDPNLALISSSAVVRIDAISANEVRGGISAQARDGANRFEISGEFTAEICPDGPARFTSQNTN